MIWVVIRRLSVGKCCQKWHLCSRERELSGWDIFHHTELGLAVKSWPWIYITGSCTLVEISRCSRVWNCSYPEEHQAERERETEMCLCIWSREQQKELEVLFSREAALDWQWWVDLGEHSRLKMLGSCDQEWVSGSFLWGLCAGEALGGCWAGRAGRITCPSFCEFPVRELAAEVKPNTAWVKWQCFCTFLPIAAVDGAKGANIS